MPESPVVPDTIAPVESPRQFTTPKVGLALAEVDRLVRAGQARQIFAVDGSPLAAAVLDTGLNVDHVDFAGRIKAKRNFTSDNSGYADDVRDLNGHGTNVAGIVGADGDHRGVAPGAGLVPLKVLAHDGSGSFSAIGNALQWVIDHHEEHSIAAVCMSIQDGQNRPDDVGLSSGEVATKIRALRDRRIAVVVSAGNEYFTHGSKQGMGYPAILREAVSVGAVYDEFEGGFTYTSGAEAFSSGPDRITPFSQRLHESVHPGCRTDVFAPGAPVTSSGIDGPHGESIQHGTSQAAPVTTGVILLMQSLCRKMTGQLAPVDDIVEILRESAVVIHDGDDESDNVIHTDLEFRRIDAFAALNALAHQLQKKLLISGEASL